VGIKTYKSQEVWISFRPAPSNSAQSKRNDGTNMKSWIALLEMTTTLAQRGIKPILGSMLDKLWHPTQGNCKEVTLLLSTMLILKTRLVHATDT